MMAACVQPGRMTDLLLDIVIDFGLVYRVVVG